MKEEYSRISMHTQHTHWSIAYKHVYTQTNSSICIKNVYTINDWPETLSNVPEWISSLWISSEMVASVHENYMLSALYPLCKTERNILLGRKLSNVQR